MGNRSIEKRDHLPPVQTNEIKGLEGFDSELLIVPRLKIVQALSAEAQEPYKIPTGSLVNNLTVEILAEPKQPLKIVPLMIGKSRINFLPKGEGISCIAKDNITGVGNPGGDCATCPLTEWTESEDGESVGPACTQFINIPVIIPDSEDLTPLMMSFGKTTFKAGRLLANLMAQKRMSPWYFMYEVSTKYVEDGKKKYYVVDVKPAGKTDPELVDIFEGAFDMLNSTEFEAYDTAENVPDDENDDIADAEVVDEEIDL